MAESLIGQSLEVTKDDGRVIVGTCDMEQKKAAKWRNVTTSKVIATESIRFRIVPNDGSRATWTTWFPVRQKNKTTKGIRIAQRLKDVARTQPRKP